MRTTPEPDRFAATYEAGRGQILATSLVGDLETPVSVALKLAAGQPYGFLLESVEGGAVRGRYSIVGVRPDLVWRTSGERAEIAVDDTATPVRFEPTAATGLASLRRVIEDSRLDMPQGLPPPSAGLFGYAGYDAVRLMERLPALKPDRLGIPDAVFSRPTLVAVIDNVLDRITLVTPVRPRPNVSASTAYEAACERLSRGIADLERPLPHAAAPAGPARPIEPVPNMSREAYHRMVEAAKEYIAAGDIFQVVPSQRFSFPFDPAPLALYRSLRRLNPSPFLFWLDLDGPSLVGSSPEILVRLRDQMVTIRPIAGTRRRGIDRDEDKVLAADLLGDPKELAEHLMLLDLGRNDVGRVAEIGSVKVTEKMIVEYYSHVMHIVSNVEGRIRPGMDALDALIAGFPAGTVSGAPKVRAMEIIEELEPERRGFYGGAVGYFAADGSMDTCIALRTALLKDGVMHVQAGGGVVADSDPEAEYQESVNKARALIRAAEETVALTRGRSEN